MNYNEFKHIVWQFYHEHRRDFAWRMTRDPYHIVVSEIMLQQTQTYRVEPKYQQFIAALPTFAVLADASLNSVLSLWQGLGYNRRGKYLHELANIVVTEHAGILPNIPEQLVQLPGIGKNTAGSICAFAFNKPVVFIETNIRTVFIHSFFARSTSVHDADIISLIAQTLDQENPREWYYALMDYGVYLKKQMANPSRRSIHHTRQSKFEGSDRQIRGAIIRLLTQNGSLAVPDLFAGIKAPAARIEPIFAKLIAEGMVIVQRGIARIG
jgi:A/G-specific adenine glycosylase